MRRDEVVRKHIEKLRITSEEAHINTVSVYRDIDIDAFLRKNNTENKIKKALIEREKYYREITNSAAYSFKENKSLKQINAELKEQNRKLQLELDKEKDTTSNTISDKKMLAKENKILREIIDTYVYPEIANELLKKSGLIHETAGVVDEKSLDNEIITSDTDVSKIKNKVVQGLFDRL